MKGRSVLHVGMWGYGVWKTWGPCAPVPNQDWVPGPGRLATVLRGACAVRVSLLVSTCSVPLVQHRDPDPCYKAPLLFSLPL